MGNSGFIVLPTIHSSAGVVSTAFAEGFPKDWKSEKLTLTLSGKGTGSGEIEGTRVADLLTGNASTRRSQKFR